MTSTQRLSLSYTLDNGRGGEGTVFCVLSSSRDVGHWQLGTCHFRLSFSWNGLVHELLDAVFFEAQHKKYSPKATDLHSGLRLCWLVGWDQMYLAVTKYSSLSSWFVAGNSVRMAVNETEVVHGVCCWQLVGSYCSWEDRSLARQVSGQGDTRTDTFPAFSPEVSGSDRPWVKMS